MPIANPTLENIKIRATNRQPCSGCRPQCRGCSSGIRWLLLLGHWGPVITSYVCQALCRLWLFRSWAIWRDQTLLANVFKKETVFKKRNRDEGESKKKNGPIEWAHWVKPPIWQIGYNRVHFCEGYLVRLSSCQATFWLTCRVRYKEFHLRASTPSKSLYLRLSWCPLWSTV